MSSLRTHACKLVDQAQLVSHELVRMAILWQEEWHESLEEASRQYFGDGNIQAMLDTLQPLHLAVEAGPTTMREMSFCQVRGAVIYAFIYICIAFLIVSRDYFLYIRYHTQTYLLTTF